MSSVLLNLEIYELMIEIAKTDMFRIFNLKLPNCKLGYGFGLYLGFGLSKIYKDKNNIETVAVIFGRKNVLNELRNIFTNLDNPEKYKKKLQKKLKDISKT